MNYEFDFIKKINNMDISIDNKISSVQAELDKLEKEANTLTIYTKNILAKHSNVIDEVSKQNKEYRRLYNRALYSNEMYQIYNKFNLDNTSKISVNRFFSKNKQLKNINNKLFELRNYFKELKEIKEAEIAKNAPKNLPKEVQTGLF